ncbi:PEP/pyruvate-binding domain-containing protein [Paenibacillus sp. GCM10012306]|uniref:PEP/pyruvate-binding domain-containing protein n=1 Tax=Paenibacillus sp. GCM10012306 TaxID=3317342 RepID=UPI00360745E2
MKYIKFLNVIDEETLSLVGGKAANLGHLIKGDFQVPPGFCITTDAYWHFVKSNELAQKIVDTLTENEDELFFNTQSSEAEIRAFFDAGKIPVEIIKEVEQAYQQLNHQTDSGDSCPVAVRSSATSEDLPHMSFAGQQDTFLHVTGIDSLLSNIVQCWSSLWTARAIDYRNRNAVVHEDQALAVVVQQMIPSKASGVFFTANPLTGKRTEIVIDATWGLGESLVSGQVDPDHFVIDVSSREIISTYLGKKGLIIRGKPEGGTEEVEKVAGSSEPALNDSEIMELVSLGERIQEYFEHPQDVEWALDDRGNFYIVQSRSITSLFPIPQTYHKQYSKEEEKSLQIWFSFASWQGVMTPFTPMGQSILSGIIGDISRYLGFKELTFKQRAFYTAAERFYVNITPLVRDTLGHTVILTIMSSLDPTIHHILNRITGEGDPRFNSSSQAIKLLKKPSFLWKLGQMWAGTARNLMFPQRAPDKLQKSIDLALANIARQNQDTSIVLLRQIKQYSAVLPKLLFRYLLPGTLSGHLPMQVLLKLTSTLPQGLQLSLDLTRSLPHNITSEMDFQLWKIALAVKEDQESYECIRLLTDSELSNQYLKNRLPLKVQGLLVDFFQKYGMRGIAEIDIGRKRWSEDPTHIFHVLKSYLEIKDGQSSPVELYQMGVTRAAEAERELESSFKKGLRGSLKRRLALISARRLRLLGGLRETPKFAIICFLDKMRINLMHIGTELTQKDLLAAAEDIFYLHIDEVEQLVVSEDGQFEAINNWRKVIEDRKEKFLQETRRKRIPRVLLSDGTAFYDEQLGSGAVSQTLSGNPVSPGIVEGRVCVMHDPKEVRLTPGDILVCPATDPAWTPLFLIAGGLIMEVGGMMTHGSVVAREYGIPAIVGAINATSRLQTGQTIRMDGMSGKIEVLSDNDAGGRDNDDGR